MFNTDYYLLAIETAEAYGEDLRRLNINKVLLANAQTNMENYLASESIIETIKNIVFKILEFIKNLFTALYNLIVNIFKKFFNISEAKANAIKTEIKKDKEKIEAAKNSNAKPTGSSNVNNTAAPNPKPTSNTNNTEPPKSAPNPKPSKSLYNVLWHVKTELLDYLVNKRNVYNDITSEAEKSIEKVKKLYKEYKSYMVDFGECKKHHQSTMIDAVDCGRTELADFTYDIERIIDKTELVMIDFGADIDADFRYYDRVSKENEKLKQIRDNLVNAAKNYKDKLSRAVSNIEREIEVDYGGDKSKIGTNDFVYKLLRAVINVFSYSHKAIINNTIRLTSYFVRLNVNFTQRVWIFGDAEQEINEKNNKLQEDFKKEKQKISERMDKAISVDDEAIFQFGHGLMGRLDQ